MDGEPPAAQAVEHAEDVEDGQINAAGGQDAEASEERLVLEFKGPGQRAFQVDAVSVGESLIPGRKLAAV